jgi:hypothetical protein
VSDYTGMTAAAHNARGAILTLYNAHGRIHRPFSVGAAQFGGGYLPDRVATRVTQLDSRSLFGSAPGADENSLAGLRVLITDQGRSGSCTFHGTPMAMWVSAAAVGRPLPFFPSPRVGYGVVRVLELPTSSTLLTDSGGMPSDLPFVVNRWGIVPIGFGGQHPTPDGRNSDVWTADDVMGSVAANINDKPSLLDLETAGLRLALKPLRIDEGPDFGAQIKAAIDNKIAGGVGIFVDSTNFMQWNASMGPIRQINTADPRGGGHWLEFDYYYTIGGELIVGGANSWGVGWPTVTTRPASPFWTPGSWEMSLTCLRSVCSDCLIFPS